METLLTVLSDIDGVVRPVRGKRGKKVPGDTVKL